jgi:hypothetical protein
MLPLFAAALTAAAAMTTAALPIPYGHAHNDYAHARPLFDALEQGFLTAEADVYLVAGELLVAHDREEIVPGRTLDSLYLEPLRAIVRESGHVIPSAEGFCLFIDIKDDAAATWEAIEQRLQRTPELFTEFRDDGVTTRAITIMLSGNRPVEELARSPRRLAAIDGRLSDLDSTHPATLMPWISDNWKKNFTWTGEGQPHQHDLPRLRGIVSRAHAQGRKIRFWGAPDHAEGWRRLLEEGVDIISTDDLAGLQRFHRERQSR